MTKKDNTLNKGAKIFVESALKAASSPFRRKLINYIKAGAHTTLDLVEKTNEDRYVIQHHLGVLIKAKLIKINKNKSKGKLKYYEMKYEKKPVIAAFSFDKEEINENAVHCNKLYRLLEDIENYPDLPDTSKISKIEVYLTYDWSK